LHKNRTFYTEDEESSNQSHTTTGHMFIVMDYGALLWFTHKCTNKA